MFSALLWIAIGLAALVCLVGLVWLWRRLVRQLVERGYLYSRDERRGGGGGVFSELDRLTRPSIQHVIEVKDQMVEQDEIDGD